jgi:hypothetical protein
MNRPLQSPRKGWPKGEAPSIVTGGTVEHFKQKPDAPLDDHSAPNLIRTLELLAEFNTTRQRTAISHSTHSIFFGSRNILMRPGSRLAGNS